MVDAKLAADHRALAPLHLAADHEQIAVDPRAARQDDVRVDRQHAAGDVAGHGERSIEHRDVARAPLRPAVDVGPLGRAQRRRRVEQRHDFHRDVARQLSANHDRVALLRLGAGRAHSGRADDAWIAAIVSTSASHATGGAKRRGGAIISVVLTGAIIRRRPGCRVGACADTGSLDPSSGAAMPPPRCLPRRTARGRSACARARRACR